MQIWCDASVSRRNLLNEVTSATSMLGSSGQVERAASSTILVIAARSGWFGKLLSANVPVASHRRA